MLGLAFRPIYLL